MITRQQAIDLYGSAEKLAAALGYTSRHAVYMWPKTGPIPEQPYLKLRYQLKPEAFSAAGQMVAKRKAAPDRHQSAPQSAGETFTDAPVKAA